MDWLLARLSESVSSAKSLEELTRPLLEMLETVTGLESTYLTSIDLDGGVQLVQFARNSGEMEIPEGLEVPWSDTLCKRSIDEGRSFTADVESCWGDSEAAAQLGIRTYASSPIYTSTGLLVGTLCAASQDNHSFSDRSRSALNLFSKLIAQHIEREMLVNQLRASNEHLAKHALTDALTGLPNRRSLLDELARLLARAAREGSHVMVGVIDLDGFKEINDTFGHAAGDRFLQACARRIGLAVRESDMLARLGGDEFAIVGPGPRDAGVACDATVTMARRVSDSLVGSIDIDGVELHYRGASVGYIAAASDWTPDHAISMADKAMYEDKRGRRLRKPA
ncbi:GGDEF domain-containing protein [Paraburkholderia phosphatilytica]|uniref:GGDEF domain-containing protein n=1 Tax=Paraburkholderia phosphatilytica TaxID=2282883 RepID=UPI000E4F0665|nr:sensor domain-containing diguanylate cyclase [Paraburkholderia phosphatilytica]